MIKIAYDYQIFDWQKYGGISRSFFETASRIANFHDYEVQIIAGLYVNKYLKECDPKILKGWYIPNLQKSKISTLINIALSKIYFSHQNPHIVHETFYSRRRLAPHKSKVVITVNDMIHEKVGHLLPKSEQEISIIKANAIKRADHIICISKNTKKDLINILNIDSDKISIVYLGYSLQKNLTIQILPKLDYPYILYVGDRGGEYKNFRRLLQAYASSELIKNNFRLVCFGYKPFDKTEIDIIHDLKLNENNIVYLCGDDSVLANLYTHAAAFVYPSLYEGFGIPPLEAMSFNCPVVCSNTSSIPEVVGEAGECFYPYEVDSITFALEKVLFSEARKNELIELGKERIKLFSWEKCAEETSMVYRSLV